MAAKVVWLARALGRAAGEACAREARGSDMLGTEGHAPEIGRETRAGYVSVGGIAGGVRREGKNEVWRTDLRRQRFAPRDDPAARGARRPGAGVETKSGEAHDGGRHGSCGDSMLNAH